MEALAATMFQAQHTELYLMFKSDCQKKEEMASWLIASWRKQDLNLPEFERIPDPIIPSTKTINVRGPHWRDEQPDGISPEKFRAEPDRSEEHTSELQSLMRISYAVFCLKKKNNNAQTP